MRERDRLRSLVLLAGYPKDTPWLCDNVSNATRVEGRMGEVEDSRLRTEGCTSTETIFATAFFWPGFRRMPRGSETVSAMRRGSNRGWRSGRLTTRNSRLHHHCLPRPAAEVELGSSGDVTGLLFYRRAEAGRSTNYETVSRQIER